MSGIASAPALRVVSRGRTRDTLPRLPGIRATRRHDLYLCTVTRSTHPMAACQRGTDTHPHRIETLVALHSIIHILRHKRIPLPRPSCAHAICIGIPRCTARRRSARSSSRRRARLRRCWRRRGIDMRRVKLALKHNHGFQQWRLASEVGLETGREGVEECGERWAVRQYL